MDVKRLAGRAVRAGVRQGIGYMKRTGRDTAALRMVDGLLAETSDAPARPPRREGPAGSRATTERTTGDAAREGLARSRAAKRSRPVQRFPKRPDGGYPGDYTGPVKPVYAPDLDGKADPGEIVWAWVPFEEDHTSGKDRPVLVIGREGRWLLGLMLTSKDNVPGGTGEVHEDGHGTYINVGAGDWDARRRPSEVRLDRIIRIEPAAVRREGAIMPMETFAQVVDSV